MGQFLRISAEHVGFQISSMLTNLSLSISSVLVMEQGHLSVPEFTETHLLTYLLTAALYGLCDVQRSEREYWLCLSAGYYST